MGRRKIEIKPIRDDRNRSVTFLKRKGGLFKKAHELSVLCSVDVAVIVFAPNKKLYEYSSSDVNEIVGRFQYYGGAHEHKGPSDFADKHGGGDDEEDEDAVESEGRGGTPGPDPAMMGMQQHPGFQHVRHATPSGSPPMNNGGMPQFQRQQSPMGAAISRPSSQASQHQGHIRRVSSNLVPPNHPQHPQNAQHPPQGAGYAYTPNPPYYNPHQQMQRQAQHPPGQATYPPPFPQQQQQHPQMQIVQDTRRQSMPPQYPQQHAPQANMQQRHPSHDHLQPPQQHPQQPQHHPQQPQHHPQQPQHQQQPSHGLPQQQNPPGPVNSPRPPPPPQEQVSPPLPQPKPLPAHAKSHSIFTPIDDSRSMLAQHWGSTSNAEPARMDPAVKLEPEGPRAQSIDIAAMQRDKEAMPRPNGMSPRPPPARPMPRSPPLPQRTNSTPSVPNTRAPNRQSAQPSDPAKRPRLKVQIPSEHSGDEGGTGSAPDDTSTSQPGTGPQGQPTASQSQQTAPAHGVVLPPPSPSAGALLSAGAQGPPNPFARPAPPMSTNPHALNRDTATAPNPNIETPISALPSRFMSDNLLPSPSTFYPEWGFGRQGDGNTLPSPLNFQTPVGTGQGQGWQQGGGRGDEDSRKRAADEEADRAGGGDGVKRSRS